jgi:hypothetical protein
MLFQIYPELIQPDPRLKRGRDGSKERGQENHENGFGGENEGMGNEEEKWGVERWERKREQQSVELVYVRRCYSLESTFL